MGHPVRPGGRVACLHDVAPDGVWPATPVTSRAVGSYPTFSPLPAPVTGTGGLFSVPLSVALDRRMGACPTLPPYSAWPLASILPDGVRTFLRDMPGDRPTRSARNCTTAGQHVQGTGLPSRPDRHTVARHRPWRHRPCHYRPCHHHPCHYRPCHHRPYAAIIPVPPSFWMPDDGHPALLPVHHP